MARVMSKSDFSGPRVDFDADARLAAIVDSSNDAIISKNLDSIITSWNASAERLFGYSADEAIGNSILMLIPQSLQGEEIDIIGRVRRGERIASYETTRRRKDGALVAVSLTVSPIRNTQGVIVGASKIARDITAAKESERRIRFLLREVNHRVKNQFAVILSIIRETGKRADSPADFEARIRDRIMALSRSHDLLVTSEWSGASLFELVKEQLQPFGHDERISLSGPLVTLQPSAVQPLGMALHELGTNSAKYGALSSDAGRLTISWQIVDADDGGRRLHLTWVETSTPLNTLAGDEARRGFGAVVLQRVTPQSLNGVSSLERSPGHLRWSLSAPAETTIVSPGWTLADKSVAGRATLSIS